MISSYNMDNMHQFSQLVSTIIVKSWPRKIQSSQDDFDEILHHLLTWPDIRYIFSFNGMSVCSDRLLLPKNAGLCHVSGLKCVP